MAASRFLTWITLTLYGLALVVSTIVMLALRPPYDTTQASPTDYTDYKSLGQQSVFTSLRACTPIYIVATATNTRPPASPTVPTATRIPSSPSATGTPTLPPTPRNTPTTTVTPIPPSITVTPAQGTPTPQPAGALPWLSVVGGHIIRIDTGATVQLRGVNLLRNEWVYPSMTYEQLAFPVLRSQWHANVVVHGFASGPVAQGDATYLGILDQYVNLAEQNHQYIILCYYYPTLNGDQPPYPGVDGSYHTAMLTLVARYRTRSNVMFMLQAEPHSDWWPAYPTGQSYRVTWTCASPNGYNYGIALRPFYDSTIADMRAVDNPSPYKHIILASGDGYGRDISPAVTDEYACHNGAGDPIQNNENVVYSSHPYDVSTQWGYWTPVADAGLPVLVTEFGTGGQMSQADTATLMGLFNGREGYAGWVSWIFDSSGCPCLLTGTNTDFVPSNPYGASVQISMTQQATIFP